MNKINGKIAFITGSTRGLGKSIAMELAACGAVVLLHGSKDSSYATSTLREIRKISTKSTMYFARIEEKNEVSKIAEIIQKKYKHLDIIINNAGIAKSAPLLDMKDDEWDTVIKVNLYGAYYTTKAFLPLLMKSTNGRIINMSSIHGIVGEYGLTNYSASKAALVGFTKALAKEMGKYNITVNAICPGFTDTGLINDVPKKLLEQYLKTIPLKRLGKKEEIAKLAAFLCSDDASYITGQAIHINGGMY